MCQSAKLSTQLYNIKFRQQYNYFSCNGFTFNLTNVSTSCVLCGLCDKYVVDRIHSYIHTYINTYIHTYNICVFINGLLSPYCCPMFTAPQNTTVNIDHSTVLTVGMSHTWSNLADKRDLTHTVPTLTISVLSASCAVHSFTDTFALTQILLLTVEQQRFPRPVPKTPITLHNAQYCQAHKHPFK